MAKTDNMHQLEQLAFDAGVAFAFKSLTVDLPEFIRLDHLRPDGLETERGLAEWRELGMVKNLERQVLNG